ncbi:MAG: Trk system potassium transporter TrkA [Methanosarcinaceae archaeon]|nr:Trk system potassium transporter TrkA [Methanosarcinaceae archaeon]
MKIVIIGAGEVGFHVAKSLYVENDVVVIDEMEDACTRVEELDVQVIRGNGANASILTSALQKAEILVALTGSDEVNIVACMAAKLIMPYNKTLKTMARVSNPDYIDKPVAKQTQLGIDIMICPELALSSEVAKVLSIPSAIEAMQFADGKVDMTDFVVQKNCDLVGKKIEQLPLPECCIVSALFRDTGIIIPHGNDIIKPNDHMVIIGESNSMHNIANMFGKTNRRRRRIMIIGGGVVGFYLAKLLSKTNIDIKIIEMDKERCNFVADSLPNVLVLNSDGADINLLKEEGVGDMDVVIALTNIDEKNLLCALLAKQLGATKVIGRVDHYDYVPLFEMVGIDKAVSPREATVKEILKLTGRTGIEMFTKIEGERAEIVEFTATDHSMIVGKPLSSVNFPKDAIINIVVHNGDPFVPGGDYVIKTNDQVLIFSLPSAHNEVERLFN